MPEAAVISFANGAKTRRIQMELAEWRARLRRAFEKNWDWRAREICKLEIRRLSDELYSARHEI